MARVFLGLGSNLGDRRANLREALRALAMRVKICGVSSLYDTAPVGYREQPRFLNLVCEVETTLAANELLQLAKQIEREMGRRHSVRYGPRNIDIDILLYDSTVISTPALTVPHPRLTERTFVLAPLAEIAGDLVVPPTGRTVAALLAALSMQDARRLEGDDGRIWPPTK